MEEVPYEGAENLHAAVHNKISLSQEESRNIITMEEFDIFGKAKEILLVLGCDRTSYNSVSMVNDVRVLNRVFSRVSGKIAVIGSSVVWSDTMLYKMIQEDFDVVRVK